MPVLPGILGASDHRENRRRGKVDARASWGAASSAPTARLACSAESSASLRFASRTFSDSSRPFPVTSVLNLSDHRRALKKQIPAKEIRDLTLTPNPRIMFCTQIVPEDFTRLAHRPKIHFCDGWRGFFSRERRSSSFDGLPAGKPWPSRHPSEVRSLSER